MTDSTSSSSGPPTSSINTSTTSSVGSLHHPHDIYYKYSNTDLTLLKPVHHHHQPAPWLPPPPPLPHEDHFPGASTYLELNAWDLNASYSSDQQPRLVLGESRNDPEPINYRPWEKPDTTTPTSSNTSPAKENVVQSSTEDKSSPPTLTPLQNAFPTFTETFNNQPSSKLPSFQSQFNSFNEQQQQQQQQTLDVPVTTTLASFLAAAPPPPPPNRYNGATTHPHNMVAATPTIVTTREPHHQPFVDDHHRHIQLFPGQVPLTHHTQFIAAAPPPAPPPNGNLYSNGHFPTTTTTSGPPATTLQLQELVPVTPTMHVIHHPPILNKGTDGGSLGTLNLLDPHQHAHAHAHHPHFVTHHNGANGLSLINGDQIPQHQLIAVKLHPAQAPFEHHHQQQQTPVHQQPQQQQPVKVEMRSPHVGNGQVNGHSNNNNINNNNGATTPSTPKRPGKRKKLENGGAGSNGHHDPAAQVSSVSSTDQSFKRPSMNGKVNGNGSSLHVDPDLDKPPKKKRKRCGECIGCQRKDNCGECAPCRNDKSHQICKMRRCDKLTEKKTPKSKLKQQAQQQQNNHQQIHQGTTHLLH